MVVVTVTLLRKLCLNFKATKNIDDSVYCGLNGLVKSSLSRFSCSESRASLKRWLHLNN